MLTENIIRDLRNIYRMIEAIIRHNSIEIEMISYEEELLVKSFIPILNKMESDLAYIEEELSKHDIYQRNQWLKKLNIFDAVE